MILNVVGERRKSLHPVEWKQKGTKRNVKELTHKKKIRNKCEDKFLLRETDLIKYSKVVQSKRKEGEFDHWIFFVICFVYSREFLKKNIIKYSYVYEICIDLSFR